jgi:hypothetical protein
MRIKKNTMNYDQNDCQQFSFITPLFARIANALKTKVGDVVSCIFEVECSVGGVLILKQIICDHFETNSMKKSILFRKTTNVVLLL